SRSDQAGSERDDVILEEAASAASIAVDGRSRSDAARIPERRACPRGWRAGERSRPQEERWEDSQEPELAPPRGGAEPPTVAPGEGGEGEVGQGAEPLVGGGLVALGVGELGWAAGARTATEQVSEGHGACGEEGVERGVHRPLLGAPR
ncbi:MAG TPA: hypothetical protein VKY90_06440, partial [Candidatus Dormibacteraeota bacterium]|nr:hypothetical protein [Candidatus Dormibacteraeota bacterium]